MLAPLSLDMRSVQRILQPLDAAQNAALFFNDFLDRVVDIGSGQLTLQFLDRRQQAFRGMLKVDLGHTIRNLFIIHFPQVLSGLVGTAGRASHAARTTTCPAKPLPAMTLS